MIPKLLYGKQYLNSEHRFNRGRQIFGIYLRPGVDDGKYCSVFFFYALCYSFAVAPCGESPPPINSCPRNCFASHASQ